MSRNKGAELAANVGKKGCELLALRDKDSMAGKLMAQKDREAYARQRALRDRETSRRRQTLRGLS